MASPYDVTWFKAAIAPRLQGFTLTYRYFEQGDFGSLHQVEFDSARKGGEFNFWGMEWLGLFLFDYDAEEVLFNRLVTQEEEAEKIHAIDAFLALL